MWFLITRKCSFDCGSFIICFHLISEEMLCKSEKTWMHRAYNSLSMTAKETLLLKHTVGLSTSGECWKTTQHCMPMLVKSILSIIASIYIAYNRLLLYSFRIINTSSYSGICWEKHYRYYAVGPHSNTKHTGQILPHPEASSWLFYLFLSVCHCLSNHFFFCLCPVWYLFNGNHLMPL